MSKEIGRKEFLKGAMAGTAAMAVSSVLSSVAFAGETTPEGVPFEGKKKFAGIGNVRAITDDIYYVGCSENRTALFENVYPIPRGVAYNSYVILDEKTVLVDTVDRSVAGQFFENLTAVLDGRPLDYLIVDHMEPDHSSAISEVLVRYPDCKVVLTRNAGLMLNNFFACNVDDRAIYVTEGDTLETGKHTLTFVLAPMVHWPEVMFTFDTSTGILFSADAFGSFGSLGGNLFADEVNFEADWLPDARRYYTNIVGKYGQNVQDVLAKAATIDIKMLCPTHGPVWRENLGWLLDKYDKWSSYTPEENAVLVVYGSVYGGTESAANMVAAALSQSGVRDVIVKDVSKTHVSELIAEAFRVSHIILASITYNMNVFTPMKNFLLDLENHNLQNRTFALIENGSWSPVAGDKMKEILDRLTGTKYVGEKVTFLSSPSEDTREALATLAQAVADSLAGGGEEEESTEEAAAPVTQWRCKVCGYIYEGETVPEDYTCPVCGVGADQFEKVE